MKRILSLILSVTMLVSALFVLSSCTSHEDGLEVNAYYVGNLFDLDPAKDFTNDDAVEIFNLLYEPLFYLNEDGSVENALVNKYSYNKDTRVLTLTFRDTCWSDGSPVVGNDLLYAWNRILACDTSSRAAALLYDVENAYYCKIDSGANGEHIRFEDVGIEVDGKDERTVYITLVEGADLNAFLRNLTNIALTPVRENTVASAASEKSGSYWSNGMAFIATSGPFTVKVWNHVGGYFTLGRNKSYRVKADAEKIDVMKYVLPSLITTSWGTLSPDTLGKFRLNGELKKDTDEYGEYIWTSELAKEEKAAKLAAYEAFMEGLETVYSDTLFYLGDAPLDKRADLKNNENTIVTEAFSTYSYVFNLRNPKNELVKDARVRNAISMMINRATIANKVVFGTAAQGLISNGVYEANDAKVSFASQRAASLIREDTNAAKALLAEAIADYSGAAYDKDGTKPIFRLVCRDTEEDLAIAKLVQSQLSSVITLKIVTLSAAYATDDIAGGKETILGNPADMSALYDGIVLAYTEHEDGGLYYYLYDDTSRTDPQQYDMIAMDYQMLSTNAFAALSSFSSSFSGCGIDTQNRGTEEEPNFSYEINKSTSGWASTEAYEAKILAAYHEKDLSKRASILHEAEALLMAEMPIVPILANQNFAAINPSLTGVTVNGYGHFIPTRAYVKNFKALPARPIEE